MMPCPRCGGDTDVKDSRKSVFHGMATVRRRRQCRKCGGRTTTFEITAGRGNMYQKMAAIPLAIDHASRALQRLRATIIESGVHTNGDKK